MDTNISNFGTDDDFAKMRLKRGLFMLISCFAVIIYLYYQSVHGNWAIFVPALVLFVPLIFYLIKGTINVLYFVRWKSSISKNKDSSNL